jgi:indole-3-glycerol phosphate synthase
MHAVLKDIIARKSREVEDARSRTPLEVLKERISELGRPRNFFQACVDRRHPEATHIIAEIKRKSPSAGTSTRSRSRGRTPRTARARSPASPTRRTSAAGSSSSTRSATR